jgi:hypothetical protein
MTDRSLRCRLQPRTIVAKVVGVDAVYDPLEPSPLGFRRRDLVEVRLAEVTAVDWVLTIVRDLELVRVDDDVVDRELARESDRFRGILFGIGR